VIAAAPNIALPRERRLAELGQDLVHAAYLRGQFVLRSGLTSNYYFDKYLFETKPSILRRLAVFMAEMVPSSVDRIAGPELGAVPLTTAISLELGLPFVIVKKKQKGYATTKQVEGELYPGERVLLIEDIVTTGSQSIESGTILRQAGAVVSDVLVVVDREEGAAQNLAAEGYQLHALFRRRDLGV
jgi:orotate phosphoribosyltransferase